MPKENAHPYEIYNVVEDRDFEDDIDNKDK